MKEYYEAVEELSTHILLDASPDQYVGRVNGLHVPALGKFYNDSELLLEPMRVFLDQIFGGYALADGKNIWCEKTPENNLHLDFILRLFPDAYFIHIKRNPYSVIASWLAMPWAPRNLDAILNIMDGLYSRWVAIKQNVDLRAFRYLEVRLEDLSVDSQGSTDALMDFLGLETIPGADFFKSLIHEARRPQMTTEYKLRVNERVGKYFPILGYEIEYN